MKPSIFRLLWVAALTLSSASADQPLGNATVSYIQNDVTIADIQLMKVQDGQVSKRPAKLREPVRNDQVVVTGGKSRAELTFADGTIARVGQHSVFSFASNSRNLEVQTGSALFHVPKNRGITEIKAGPVTASIVGTTLLVQVFSDYVLIYVYEGTVKAGASTITGGQVLRLNHDGTTSLSSFDVRQGASQAALFTKFIDAPSTEVFEIAFQEAGIPLPENADVIADAVLNSRFRLIHQNPQPPPPTIDPPKPPPPPPPSSFGNFFMTNQ